MSDPTLPSEWTTMASTSAIGAKQVTVNGFTFLVLSFSNESGQMFKAGLEEESMSVVYKIIDKTDYSSSDPNNNPRLKYGNDFGLMLYTSLRSLAYNPTYAPSQSGIYLVGSWIFLGPFTQNKVRVMSANVSLENEKMPDVFILTLECEVSYTNPTLTGDGTSKAERKIRASFKEAPWNKPVQLNITSNPENWVNGYAYCDKVLRKTTTKGKITASTALKYTLFGENDFGSVVNTAGEPFLSPVPLKGAVAYINIEGSYTEKKLPSLPTKIYSQVNEGKVALVYRGVKLLDCEPGTLAFNGWTISPEVWLQEIPWYPGEKHPLGYTYGEIYQTSTAIQASKIVLNESGSTVNVKKEYGYFRIKASFVYRAGGHGALVPNRGKNYLKASKLVPVTKYEMGRVDEAYLNEAGDIAPKDSLTFLGFSSYYKGSGVAALLNSMLSKSGGSTITWAKGDEK